MKTNELMVKAKSLAVAVQSSDRHTLAFTRYCYCQSCMVYGIHTGGWRGVVYCAMVVQ